ncbi:MAG: hypothetical protein JW806_09520 [Sedimentisphaerales bacterium]|nr:hypothetical protein [Sedimentisphaerales bacterium]
MKNMRGFFQIILISGIIFFLYSGVFAYSGGDGSAGDPYRIADVNDLLELAADTSNYDKSFRVINDIDLSGYSFTNAVIASEYSQPFIGVFDGNDHVISDLTIDAGNNYYAGLFGRIDENGVITNAAIEDVNITGGSSSGGLAGSNSGTITGCYVTGTVSGFEYVGGLVGYGSNITNCYATGTVSGGWWATGGLVGDGSNITDCHADCSVNGRMYAGGLVGEGGNITNCYATGAVFGQWESQMYWPQGYAGGLVGDGSNITNCYATGSVDVDGDLYAGGLVGAGHTITDCYSTGAVNGGNRTTGGLAGSGHTITNCYSTGTVDGNDLVGGLVGYCSEANDISASFWDVNTSGITDGVGSLEPDPNGATGLPTSQMKMLSTFTSAGWDFVGETANGSEDIWGMLVETTDYPKLYWQLPYEPYTGGTGEPNDPYRIANVYGLFELASDVNYYNDCFILTNDINLAGYNFTSAVIAPDTDNVQNYFQGTVFDGVFDGDGFVISSLTINGNDNRYIGLFGYTGANCLIKNVVIEDAEMSGGLHMGGLTGYNNGDIINCCIEAVIVSSDDYAGGLVGYNESSGSITGCCSTGSIDGFLGIGGIAGYNKGDIDDCYSHASVDGLLYIGGLTGFNYGSDITNCYSTGAVSGNSYVGGLTGMAMGGTGYFDTFWDVNSSGTADGVGGVNPDPAGATGLPTSQMQTESTFTSAGWDFNTPVWDICDGTYPKLAWQILLGDFVCPEGVSLEDLEHFIQWWLVTDCSGLNNNCEGTDIKIDGIVDFFDFVLFADNWLKE